MIGKRIETIRKERGWTLRALAEATGFSIGHIAAIEKGRVVPKVKTVAIIAERLGVEMSAILG